MDKIRRNERMSAMMKILAAKPNRIFTPVSYTHLTLPTNSLV